MTLCWQGYFLTPLLHLIHLRIVFGMQQMLNEYLSSVVQVEKEQQWVEMPKKASWCAQRLPGSGLIWSIYHGTGSRRSAEPATGSWEFLKVTGLGETDWLTNSQETDGYIRTPINTNKCQLIKIDPSSVPGELSFPNQGTTIPQGRMSGRLSHQRLQHECGVRAKGGEYLTYAKGVRKHLPQWRAHLSCHSTEQTLRCKVYLIWILLNAQCQPRSQTWHSCRPLPLAQSFFKLTNDIDDLD